MGLSQVPVYICDDCKTPVHQPRGALLVPATVSFVGGQGAPEPIVTGSRDRVICLDCLRKKVPGLVKEVRVEVPVPIRKPEPEYRPPPEPSYNYDDRWTSSSGRSGSGGASGRPLLTVVAPTGVVASLTRNPSWSF
jgi:hypothetical protein